MKQTHRKPLEFKPAKPRKPSAKSPAFEPQHQDFLDFVATGHSIGDAAALVGATRAAYEKWRNRNKGFKAAVEAARESHRRDIACGLHGADAYARMLLDAIQRDESLPAPLRYRASKTILTRKGKADWLPDPIPAESEPLAPYDDEQPESLTDGFVLHPHRTEQRATSAPTSPRERNESESATSATASCGQGQSESASAACGNAPSILQAPKPAAEASASNLVTPEAAQASAPKASAANATPEAGSRKPEAVRAPASTPNPDNPDKPNRTPAAENSIKNQQDPPTPTIPAAASKFFSNPDNHSQAVTVPNPHPEAAQASAPKASAANSAPEAGSRKPCEPQRAPRPASSEPVP